MQFKGKGDIKRKNLTQQSRELETQSLEQIGKHCILTSGEHHQEDVAALANHIEDAEAK